MLSVALVEPEIPPNTGNIARLCAATNVPLHIVGVTGFRMDDRAVRRAGLDYWPEVQLTRHKDLESLYQHLPQARFVYLTTKADRSTPTGSFKPTIVSCLAVRARTSRGSPARKLEQLPENPDTQSTGA